VKLDIMYFEGNTIQYITALKLLCLELRCATVNGFVTINVWSTAFTTTRLIIFL
jgi:hypothetical protein